MFSLLFYGRAVFATDDITITLSSDTVNIVYSGDRNGDTDGDSRGKYTRIWSATATNVKNAYRFGMQSNNVTPKTNSWNKWDNFAVRCIKQ